MTERPLKCDFCSLVGPTWEFPTDTFDLGWKTVDGEWNRSGGSWLACDRCRKTVDEGKHELLMRRGIYSVVRELAPQDRDVAEAVLTDMVREMHADFWRHRRGPAIPLTEERRREYASMPEQVREEDAPIPDKIAGWAQKWGVGL